MVALTVATSYTSAAQESGQRYPLSTIHGWRITQQRCFGSYRRVVCTRAYPTSQALQTVRRGPR